MKTRSVHRRHAAFNSRQYRGRVLIASGLSLASVLSVTDASAQSAAAPAAAASAPKANEPVTNLETVVVTARKTQEKLSDVPLAITAIGSKELADTGVKNILDISKLAPGVSVTTAGAEANLTIVIRGLTNLNAGSGDPNVAVFLDGVYLANPSAISLGLIDIERVELIKGPVSALYGRNAFGGVLNYVSKKPYNELEGNVSATVSSHGGITETATISGPLIKNMLTARLTVGGDKSSGSYKDDVTGLHVGGFRKKDGQLSFNFTPTKALTATGALYYGNDYFSDPAEAYLDNNCGPTSSAAVSAGQFTQYCGKIDATQHPVEVPTLNPNSGATGNKRHVIASNIKVNYDLGLADASALLGYNKVTDRRFSDFTGHRDGIPFQTTAGIVDLHELFGADANNNDKSLELRLASKQNQPIRGAAGMYLYNAKSIGTTIIGIDGSGLPAGATLNGPLASIQDFFLTPYGNASTSNFTEVGQTDRVASPFATVDVDFNSVLTGSVEARHTLERKSQDIIRNAFVTNTVEPYGAPTQARFAFNNERGSLRFKPMEDEMFYASIANGTKAGGFNSRATIASEISFKPETNVTLEAGTKLSFLEKRLQLDLSVFNIRTKSIQISGPSDDPHNTGLVTKNFGGTNVNGFDLDLAAVPVKGLTVNAGVGYSDPKFTNGTYDFSNASVCSTIPSCAPLVTTVNTPQGTQASVVNLKGLHVPLTSNITTSVGVQYDGRINDEWGYFGRADYRYESKRYTTPDNFSYIGARKIVNLNAGISSDRYSVKLFVNNLTNDKTPDSVTANTRLNDFVANQVAYMPILRTYGVTVGIEY